MSSSWSRRLWSFQRNAPVPTSSSSIGSLPPNVTSSSAALTLLVVAGKSSRLEIPNFGEGDGTVYLLDAGGGSSPRRNISLIDSLETVLSSVPVRYDSRLIYMTRATEGNSIDLWEVYRIDGERPLTVKLFATWDRSSGGDLEVTAWGRDPIWFRRANLEGHHFRLTARDNIPFITK